MPRLDYSLHASAMLEATIPALDAPVTQALFRLLVQRIAVLMEDATHHRCDITTAPRGQWS